MFDAIKSFVLTRPLLSHGLLAFLDFLILGLGLLHPLLGVYGALIAASFISVFFYGREAGQLEHDFKRDGVSPLRAWFRATFIYGWPWTNVMQWLVPTAVAFASALAYLLLRAFL